ncbi:MAG: pilus assembly PilX N-terminal domain-containing protein [Gammaproteobacteria bacterium]|nr:pilus assembly PilX N-terminal domain-containing protein [Gammaproteobacteria bacterium]
MNKLQRNKGATLAIVLIFLLIITVLGVSSMSDSIIQQKSSTNLYLENEAFHVAESAVSATIYDSRVNDNPLYGVSLDDDVTKTQGYCIGDNGLIARVGAVDPDTNEEFCNNINKFEDIDGLIASSEVEYLGCIPCPGYELLYSTEAGGYVGCNAWQITGTGNVGEKTNVDVDSWAIQYGLCSADQILFSGTILPSP